LGSALYYNTTYFNDNHLFEVRQSPAEENLLQRRLTIIHIFYLMVALLLMLNNFSFKFYELSWHRKTTLLTRTIKYLNIKVQFQKAVPFFNKLTLTEATPRKPNKVQLNLKRLT
jgi:hypothetical protein